MNAIFETAAGNAENQDRGAVIDCGKNLVLVIADGAGGLSGATEAAIMAVDLARQHALNLDGPDSCSAMLKNMDRAIAKDKIAGQTTCIVAVIRDGRVDGASVGDSGAWVVGENNSLELTRGQIRKPFVGSGNATPVSFSHTIQSGERLLLATDGLFKYTSSDRIIDTCRLHLAESIPKKLIELVRYPSGALPDDITIILL